MFLIILCTYMYVFSSFLQYPLNFQPLCLPSQRKRKVPACFGDNTQQSRPRQPPHQPPVEASSPHGNTSNNPLGNGANRHKSCGRHVYSNENIDLASLLAEETDSNDSFRLVESTNGTVALQKLPQHKCIVSLNQWNTAFHKYISILTESQPL